MPDGLFVVPDSLAVMVLNSWLGEPLGSLELPGSFFKAHVGGFQKALWSLQGNLRGRALGASLGRSERLVWILEAHEGGHQD